jgi:SAM-dependent methyltransferase
LADVSNTDIFYDLGCGIGQLCIVAVTEFGVKKAVGLESHEGRAKKAKNRIEKLGLGDRIQIRNEDFWQSDTSEATIAYYGQIESDEDVADFETTLCVFRLRRPKALHCGSLTCFSRKQTSGSFTKNSIQTNFTHTIKWPSTG